MVPSNYVQIVDSNEAGASDNIGAPPALTTCPDDDPYCPYINPQQLPPRPTSATSTYERPKSALKQTTTCVGGSQSTLNTFCSSSRKSQQQPNAVFNRLYSSDPNTNLLGGELAPSTDDPDYMYNYAHVKHSHRHPHYHFRRQSQPENELRLMSRNSSTSVKSFTSQSFNNPEYFQEMRPARSYDDSRASLLSRKLSNQIMLLNSELALLEQMRDHSQSYPKLNGLEKDYMTLMETTTLQNRQQQQQQAATSSSTPSESSDVSEFHENKTSTLDRKSIATPSLPVHAPPSHHAPPAPPPRKHLFSETDSYSTLNDEITQLVSKHFSDSIKRLIAARFNEVETYEVPSNLYRRRRHSCGSSDSFDDVLIPELFSSPSRIKWSFLMGLPDLSRSHSQIGSSDYRTDDYDDEEEESQEEEEEEDEQTVLRPMCKIDQILNGHANQQRHHHDRDKTVSIWQTSTQTSSDDCSRAVIFHHDSGLVENCCENHFKANEEGKKSAEEDSTVYEFELCTKENCEYLLQSQIELQPSPMAEPQLPESTSKSQLNNENTSTSGGKASNKNINLKHNKFKMKKKAKKKSTPQLSNHRTQQTEDLLAWSKLNLSHIMKKESCAIDSVNLKKPNSNSSSSTSLDNGAMASTSRKNLAKCYKKSSTKLRQQTPGSLDIAALILASSSSTQARLRSDGAIYFSNPDLSAIPAEVRTSMTTRIGQTITNNNSSNNNNSCQFINNDLRSNSTNNNVNSTSSAHNNPNSSSNASGGTNPTNVNRFSLIARVSSQRRATAAHYLNETINSNNIDNSGEFMMQQQLHFGRRLRYNQFNLHGIVRRAQRSARKYLNALRRK